MGELGRWVRTTFNTDERGGPQVVRVGMRSVENVAEWSANLEKAIKAYRKALNSHDRRELTPHLVHRTWELFWQERTRGTEENFIVPPCDRTKVELAELAAQNRGMIFLPEAIMEDFSLFFSLFPEVRRTSALRNTYTEGGWVDIEMETTLNNNTGQTLNMMKAEILERNKTGKRAQTYVIGSLFYQLVTGEFFDPAVLPGSQYRTSSVTGQKSRRGDFHFTEGRGTATAYRTEGKN